MVCDLRSFTWPGTVWYVHVFVVLVRILTWFLLHSILCCIPLIECTHHIRGLPLVR